MPGSPKVETHYVVNVTVEKVIVTTPDATYKPNESRRDKAEIARIVFRDGNLSNLKSRVGAHITLIEDEPR